MSTTSSDITNENAQNNENADKTGNTQLGGVVDSQKDAGKTVAELKALTVDQIENDNGKPQLVTLANEYSIDGTGTKREIAQRLFAYYQALSEKPADQGGEETLKPTANAGDALNLQNIQDAAARTTASMTAASDAAIEEGRLNLDGSPRLDNSELTEFSLLSDEAYADLSSEDKAIYDQRKAEWEADSDHDKGDETDIDIDPKADPDPELARLNGERTDETRELTRLSNSQRNQDVFVNPNPAATVTTGPALDGRIQPGGFHLDLTVDLESEEHERWYPKSGQDLNLGGIVIPADGIELTENHPAQGFKEGYLVDYDPRWSEEERAAHQAKKAKAAEKKLRADAKAAK